MGSRQGRSLLTLFVSVVIAACAAETSPSPTTTGVPTSPSAAVSASPRASASSPLAPPAATASLPVQGSAREFSTSVVLMAPGPNGGIYVLIPTRAAPAVLALLDQDGHPAAGWPVALDGATSCSQVLPVVDGSVRVICSGENPGGDMFDPIGIFAFDPDGRSLSGWPVQAPGFQVQGRVVGTDLVLVARGSLGDVIDEGQPDHDVGIVTIAADGALTSGVRLPITQGCCDVWGVGPDGIAYGVVPATADPSPQQRLSWIAALDATGVRAGWPVTFDDIASGPAFGANGRTLVLVGSVTGPTSRVVAFDMDGRAASATSPEIPMAAVEATGDTGGCTVFSAIAPIVAPDGTAFVYSELDARFYALDLALAVRPGWPFEPDQPLAYPRPGLESEHEAGYCPPPALPAVGPDGTLYRPLAASRNGGGSLVAVGPDGLVQTGWPVQLTRAGAEFWSVVAGPDGTVFALALEPESGRASSATILGIAPDSTVLWTTTIVEP